MRIGACVSVLLSCFSTSVSLHCGTLPLTEGQILCGFVLALFLETYNLNDTNMLREIVVIKSFKGGMTKLYVFSKGHSNCGSLCFGNLVERDIWKS